MYAFYIVACYLLILLMSILRTAEASNFSKCSKRIESAKKRARKAAEMFQSEHPFFKAVLRRHNIYNSFVVSVC
jgi:hypothetical protein